MICLNQICRTITSLGLKNLDVRSKNTRWTKNETRAKLVQTPLRKFMVKRCGMSLWCSLTNRVLLHYSFIHWSFPKRAAKRVWENFFDKVPRDFRLRFWKTQFPTLSTVRNFWSAVSKLSSSTCMNLHKFQVELHFSRSSRANRGKGSNFHFVVYWKNFVVYLHLQISLLIVCF